MSAGNIAKRWRQLSGQHRWKGLIEPLDIDLRRYLIIYGQLAQVNYDAFNLEVKSRFAGNSRYSMKDLFRSVGLEVNNPFKYTPVKYLYATSRVGVPESFIVKSIATDPAIKQSNWIGYIAVATDEGKKALGRRDIAVAWRGTLQTLEWIKDFDYPLISASDILGSENNARVHQGFHSVYTSDNPNSPFSKTSARQQLLEGLKEQLEKYKNEETSVTVTGHSLGAALATLSAADIVANGLNRSGDRASNCKDCPVTAFPFACPRTGDANFKRICDSMEDLHILRTTNRPDVVPQVPPIAAGYSDVGQELVIDTRRSPYLKPVGDLASWHNLEVYLHGIAGTQGKNNSGFHLEVKRDIALVNKELDALKIQYLVPAYWWVLANRAMIQQPDGSWKLDGYRPKGGHWELDDNGEDNQDGLA